MLRSAYLRVYVPATGERTPPKAERTPARTLITVGDYGLVFEPLRNDVLEVEWNGDRFVCPRTPRLRMLEGLLSFRSSYPGLTGDLLVPEPVADRAWSELESLRDRNPGLRSHMQVSPWHIPLRWFSLFDPSEREVVAGDQSLSIRYRTTQGRAMARIERAIEVLDEAGFHDSIVDPVRDLARWLASFSDGALVELDYGSVAGLFSDGDLAMDETCADVRSSLRALEEGDLEAAGDSYGQAAGRWAGAQALAYMN